MAQNYFGIVTRTGHGLITAALAAGTTVNLTHIALGDGGGAVVAPTEDMAALVNEVHRAPINALTQDAENPALMWAEVVLPANVGGWYVREAGIIDDAGNLIAVAGTPESYKPELAEGSGSEFVLRLPLVLTNTEAVTLDIDPTVVLASRQHVAAKVAEHNADAEAHADIRAAVVAVTVHAERTDNPHGVTAEQVGASPLGHTHDENGVDDVARLNNVLNAFDIAILDARTGSNPIVDGVLDTFEDTTGISSTTGAAHDAADHLYGTSGDYTADLTETSELNDAPATASSHYGSDLASEAYDGSLAAADMWQSTAIPAWNMYDFGAGNEKIIRKYGLVGVPTGDTGYVSRAPSTWVFQGSNDASTWTDLHSVTSKTDWSEEEWFYFEFPNTTAYRYYRFYITAAVSDSTYVRIVEAQMMGALAPNNMELISVATTAAAQPDNAVLAVHFEAIDTVALNTDLVASVSRDGGTTWTAETLAERIDYGGDETILTCDVDISGQPPGTSMQWKLESFNNMALNIHAVGLMWR